MAASHLGRSPELPARTQVSTCGSHREKTFDQESDRYSGPQTSLSGPAMPFATPDERHLFALEEVRRVDELNQALNR